MYRVMVNIYFKCQDGWNYMSHECSGIKYKNIEEAKKELEKVKEAGASKTYEGFYIEEC